MTDQDMATAYAAADLRDVGATMQAILGADMTLETYLTGSVMQETLVEVIGATVLVAQADHILGQLGVNVAGLYN